MAVTVLLPLSLSGIPGIPTVVNRTGLNRLYLIGFTLRVLRFCCCVTFHLDHFDFPYLLVKLNQVMYTCKSFRFELANAIVSASW